MPGWIPNFLIPGFARITLNSSWRDASAIPDLSGKTAIVLGANTGIGYETALQLARKGAKVYATARSSEKAVETISKIEAELKDENVEVFPLVVPLDDFNQVRNAARAFLVEHKRLDILVNNAGILDNEFHLTKDSVEYDFAVNYVSHFIFTTTLLPIFSPGARIVNVSSFAQQFGKIILDLDRINNPEDPELNSWLARYGHSKTAQVLFTRGLQHRVNDNVFVNCCHPGQIGTGLNRTVAAPGTGMQGMAIRLAMRLFDQPPSVGALTQLYLATSQEVEKKDIKGQLFFPVAMKAMDKISKIALDDEMVEKLWTWTEKLVHQKLKD